MMIKINLLVFSIFAIALMCFKCEKNGVIWEEAEFFTVKDSYVQKVVPGSQTEEIGYEIGCELRGLEVELSFDSLYYKNKICRNVKLYDTKLVAKVREASSLGFQELEGFQNEEEAILFYSSGQSQYYCILTEMKVKETLYFP